MKDVFNRQNIGICADLISAQLAGFDRNGFYNKAVENIEQHELKQRSQQIFEALELFLPNDFYHASQVLINTLHPVVNNQELGDISTNENGVAGWIILPYSQFVGVHGGHDVPLALETIRLMTKRFTSEFGIRYLYLSHPMECLDIVKGWLNDPCHHVRRLVSEGCRPLLPWAMQLPLFKSKPEHILPLLDALKNDTSEYVRRSVANNLNDISKHHPDLVADLIRTWLLEADINRLRLLKHASRTLIKQGHSKTLTTFGYGKPENIDVRLTLESHVIVLGEALNMAVTLTNRNCVATKVLLDFVVYHQKANGRVAPKVFKWSALSIDAYSKQTLTKKHVIKAITTRRYYSGLHYVAVLVNGQEFAKTEFELRL